ncbi:MAG: zinc transporter ZupT [Calditrichaceae bacterium]|nr:zinc transporter ZupT [Calditrichaceae bacterium]MBN2710044.1 zinc transporter ZupT [Calditrichaceae bacterium]RQV92143.1 MAG: zinc transporter ZupT [Calditrichota bacterium]
MEESNLLVAFFLTLFAGLSTGIGSAMAFLTKRTNTKFLSLALGFSAGVMIYVSMIEIVVKAKDALVDSFGYIAGNWLAVAGFFTGILVIALIDKFVPSYENPHEMHLLEELKTEPSEKDMQKLKRMGILTALAIAIHNFPEGLATFMAALDDPNLGIPIATAIAIHNIPEGIAVSIPLFYATNNRKKSFLLSFSSGLAEPVGAIVGYFLIFQFVSESVFGFVFASVAGIMVFISLDELLPAAREYGQHHLSIYGLVSGMIIMAFSLLMFL